MIQKVTIEAVSIRKNKKTADGGVGAPYMWNDKKTNTQKPRTMVSICVKENGQDVWYMGWSYKDGSAAENLKKGDVVEVLLTQDGDFLNWKFPKQEDKDAQEIADLKKQLAMRNGTGATEAAQTPTPVTTNPAAEEEPPF